MGKGTTLCVVPAALCLNWESELKRHFINVSGFLYHGTCRKKKFQDYLLKNTSLPDIIICSYQSLASESDSPLFDIPFYRLIFDECHYIKNTSSAAFRAVSLLKSEVKWFMSGTPILNKSNEIHGILRLLGYEGLNALYTRSMSRYYYQQLQSILSQIAMRRYKKDVLKSLPSKKWVHSITSMNGLELDFYTILKSYSRTRAI